MDKLFILDGCQDGPVRTIAREARKKDTIINYVSKERLDQLSETRAHQGVIAQVAAYEYSTVEEILEKAEKKENRRFWFFLTMWRILIIWARSSYHLIWQEPTV